MNYLLNGDNLDVLTAITPSFLGSVDLVYIDPPYNTGKQMGKYKDAFGSHKQWIDFMCPRLTASLPLLKDSAITFISIGVTELAHLKILCDKVFGEKNLISLITWQNKHTTANDKNGIASQTEYILAYAKNISRAVINKDRQRQEYLDSTYKNPDNDPRGPWRGGVQLHKKKTKPTFAVRSPTGKEWVLGWNYSQKAWTEELEKNNLIWWGEKGDKCPVKKVFLQDVVKEGRTPVNLWLGNNEADQIRSVGFTGDGSLELERITGVKADFLYPKPLKLIKRILSIASRPDSIVMDYFAGSGTTGQAVLEYNKDYGGSRKFILVTNNENGICENITKKRIENAINGYSYSDSRGGKVVVPGTGGEYRYLTAGLQELDSI
jgi:adenine-specific DNA-methyltransferase